MKRPDIDGVYEVAIYWKQQLFRPSSRKLQLLLLGTMGGVGRSSYNVISRN